MNVIKSIFLWSWRTIWGLVWLSMVVIVCGLGLLLYFQKDASNASNIGTRSSIDGQWTIRSFFRRRC